MSDERTAEPRTAQPCPSCTPELATAHASDCPVMARQRAASAAPFDASRCAVPAASGRCALSRHGCADLPPVTGPSFGCELRPVFPARSAGFADLAASSSSSHIPLSSLPWTLSTSEHGRIQTSQGYGLPIAHSNPSASTTEQTVQIPVLPEPRTSPDHEPTGPEHTPDGEPASRTEHTCHGTCDAEAFRLTRKAMLTNGVRRPPVVIAWVTALTTGTAELVELALRAAVNPTPELLDLAAECVSGLADRLHAAADFALSVAEIEFDPDADARAEATADLLALAADRRANAGVQSDAAAIAEALDVVDGDPTLAAELMGIAGPQATGKPYDENAAERFSYDNNPASGPAPFVSPFLSDALTSENAGLRLISSPADKLVRCPRHRRVVMAGCAACRAYQSALLRQLSTERGPR